MDERGYWHYPSESMEAIADELQGKERRLRAVISLEPNELVRVVTGDGSYCSATFKSAEKNKVTLTPVEGGMPMPYLDFARTVTLEKATGEKIEAQVWDNRNGSLILRTLPIRCAQ